MIFLIYFKLLFALAVIFFSGITITRRVISDTRAQIIIPTGIILGLAIFLFLVNSVGYLIKGQPLFVFALTLETLLAFLIRRKMSVEPIRFPQGLIKKLWIISLVFWGILLYLVVSTSPFNGGHDSLYYSHASSFARGDFPIHLPWQPDYLSYHHLGASQLLGAMRSLIGSDYAFLQGVISFFMLFAWSQILTWLIILKYPKKIWHVLPISIPALVFIISLGGFMIVWPNKLSLPEFNGNLFSWLSQLPVITFPEAGSTVSFTIDSVILFFQRVLALSFFLAALPILISPSRKTINSLITLTCLLAMIALTEEAVFIMALPAIVLGSFFILRNNLKQFFLFLLLTATIISIQGGPTTQVLLHQDGATSGVLIFPKDGTKPAEKFRSFRLEQQSAYLFPNQEKYQPFRWLNPGIIPQLTLLLLGSLLLLLIKRINDQNYYKFKVLILFFLTSSLVTYVAYHIIVPYPFQLNGRRFLELSYQMSGLSLAFLVIYWWGFLSKKLLPLKILIVWVLAFSLIPPLAHLFPRRADLDWFKPHLYIPKASFEWIKNNLKITDRVIALTDKNPVPSGDMDLAIQIGALIPLWPEGVKNHDLFDISPTYADLFYTLNPKSLRLLKVQYLIISNPYLSTLPQKRINDIYNTQYFQPIFRDSTKEETIVQVMPKYLEKGENLGGTFEDLDKAAPKEGVYYIDQKSTSSNKDLYRPLEVLFRNRTFYGYPDYWNGRVDIELPFYGLKANHYDYLVLGDEADPKSFCQCQARVVWSGLGDKIKLWKTE